MDEPSEIINEFERIQNLPPAEGLKYYFKRYLETLDQSEELINISQELDWNMIYSIICNECKTLWNKMVVPKHIEGLGFTENLFLSMVIDNIQHYLFYFLIMILKENLDKQEFNEKLFNGTIQKVLTFMINEFLAVFDFQLTLSSIDKNNDPKTIILKIEELKQKAKRGAKFMGKHHRPYEKEAVEKVFKQYNEAKEKGLRTSLRMIAMNVARIDLELIHEREQNNFYKRCSEYLKNKK